MSRQQCVKGKSSVCVSDKKKLPGFKGCKEELLRPFPAPDNRYSSFPIWLGELASTHTTVCGSRAGTTLGSSSSLWVCLSAFLEWQLLFNSHLPVLQKYTMDLPAGIPHSGFLVPSRFLENLHFWRQGFQRCYPYCKR